MEKKAVMAMLKYYDKVHRVTLKAIKLIPAKKLNYKPCPEVMSIKELVHHIYTAEKVLVQAPKKGVITEEDFKKERRDFRSVKSLLNYAKKVHQNTNRIVKSLTNKQLKKNVKAFWGDQFPAYDCFFIMFGEHRHHRGQLFTYLRLLGIKPTD